MDLLLKNAEKIRMEHASELLKGTKLTVEDISDRVGYESVYAFSRAFRQYYNIPPGAYRKAFCLRNNKRD